MEGKEEEVVVVGWGVDECHTFLLLYSQSDLAKVFFCRRGTERQPHCLSASYLSTYKDFNILNAPLCCIPLLCFEICRFCKSPTFKVTETNSSWKKNRCKKWQIVMTTREGREEKEERRQVEQTGRIKAKGKSE